MMCEVAFFQAADSRMYSTAQIIHFQDVISSMIFDDGSAEVVWRDPDVGEIRESFVWVAYLKCYTRSN